MNGKARYVLAVDQSTQGTKGLLFDEKGELVFRADKSHRQLVNEKGWVSHDPEEILENTLEVAERVLKEAGISGENLCALGISNQRETSLAWNRESGKPLCPAVVWQCARAEAICDTHRKEAETIRKKTGLPLSPYFPAAKLQWIMETAPEAAKLVDEGKLALGTMDSWLLYALSEERVLKTDYSNASRTQLFNIHTLAWDPELLKIFRIPRQALPKVCMSDAVFGTTKLGGLLKQAIPICGVLGDSHGALFGQDCRKSGQLKATYGTGSSVMMNTGDQPVCSARGLVTSLAWGLQGRVSHVLEGNLNYTGAVISWMKEKAGLIDSPEESGKLAAEADPEDRSYFVPAFTGLGAPYWDSKATGMFTGITRITGKKELVKAGLESIGYQVTDLVKLMEEESGNAIRELRVDGGPTGNQYLMQFQADLSQKTVSLPEIQELSGFGAACVAGLSAGLYREEELFAGKKRKTYHPRMEASLQKTKYEGWKQAVRQTLLHGEAWEKTGPVRLAARGYLR